MPPDTYKQIEVNGTTLHYLESGSRASNTQTLVLSHAHISDLRSFTSIQSLLAPHFHIINYSRRFSWPNSPLTPEEHDDWHLHARDLAALITTLDLSPVHILGNSSGAAIPLLLAQTNPYLIASLILEEPPLPYVFLPTLPPSPWQVLSFLFKHPTAFLPNLLFGLNVINPVTTHCKANPPRKLEALEIFAPGACSTAAWLKIKSNPDQSRMQQVLDNLDIMVNMFRYEDTPIIGPEQLAKVKCPALMVTGTETIAAQKCIDWKVVMCLGSEVKREVLVQGAAHLVHEDQPERVVEIVSGWVGEVGGSGK